MLHALVGLAEMYYECADKMDALIEHEKGKPNGPGNDKAPQ